jgi:hypothetical protein
MIAVELPPPARLAVVYVAPLLLLISVPFPGANLPCRALLPQPLAAIRSPLLVGA